MGLTVEQKINMLILAGYEPMHNSGSARIVRPPCALIGGSRSYIWSFYENWGHKEDFYEPIDWAELMLVGCPDELIYEACDANR